MKEKFKYKNSKCIIRLLRRLVEKSIKIQNFHNRDPLVSLIRTAASDLPIEDIFVIGELEIYCLKALSFSGCNGLELIVRLVDGLLPLVKKEVAPITYARYDLLVILSLY